MQQIQRKINGIIRRMFKNRLDEGKKEVTNKISFNFGACRRLFSTPTEADKELIRHKIDPFLQETA